MDGLTFEVFGNKAIMDNLDKLDQTLRDAVQVKLEGAGEVGLQVSEDLCPVDTGFLRSRLDLEVAPGEVKLTNDAPYAMPVITGHRTSNGGYVPANDFLTPGMIAGAQWLKQELRGII